MQETPMTTRGLLIRLDAKHGKDREVEAFLRSVLPLVQQEPGTTEWFALRFGRGEYGIVDVFSDDAARDAHLSGAVADALRARASELFDEPPSLRKFDVLADKLPSVTTAAVTKGLLLTFHAKTGHIDDIEDFLRNARQIVEDEPKTIAWFAIRLDGDEYGIFDVFPDEHGRLTHLTGGVARQLAVHALTLLGSLPHPALPEVLAAKW
jgi:quinol monooxygenase YgiN